VRLESEWQGAADRWLAADDGGREVEAETEFASVLRARPRLAPSAQLEARIWRATRWVRFRSRGLILLRRAGVSAAALGAAALTLYVAATLLIPLAVRGLIRLVASLVSGFVWITLAFTEGLDTWSLLTQVGRAIGNAIATPEATAALIIIELIGVLAFHALNRVLAREKEISQ
jgi:hypothetical protein